MLKNILSLNFCLLDLIAGSLGKRKPEEDVEGEAPAKRTLNDCEEVVPDVGGDAPASEPQMGSATAVEDAPADGIVPVDPIMPVMVRLFCSCMTISSAWFQLWYVGGLYAGH